MGLALRLPAARLVAQWELLVQRRLRLAGHLRQQERLARERVQQALQEPQAGRLPAPLLEPQAERRQEQRLALPQEQRLAPLQEQRLALRPRV